MSRLKTCIKHSTPASFVIGCVQDLISKWEKYVADHQVFDNRLAEYNDWILQATQKLEQCSQSVGDQESMEEKRAMIHVGCNIPCTHSLFHSVFWICLSFSLLDLSLFQSFGFLSVSLLDLSFFQSFGFVSFSLLDLSFFQSFGFVSWIFVLLICHSFSLLDLSLFQSFGFVSLSVFWICLSFSIVDLSLFQSFGSVSFSLLSFG